MKLIEQEPWYALQNAVPLKPWVWATIPGQATPVEVVSYPWLDEAHKAWRIMVRRKVGDPTSIQEVDAKDLAAFDPADHEYASRERVYYSDNPTVFHFRDELPQGKTVMTVSMPVEGAERLKSLWDSGGPTVEALRALGVVGVEWADDKS